MEQTARRRFPIGRAILCTIGAALLYACVYYAYEHVRLSRELEAARTARMGETQVDLSKAGQIRVPARFDFRAAHGISLILTGASEKSLGGLGARVAVAAKGDLGLEWQEIKLEYCRQIGDDIELCRDGAPGQFTFVLDVQRPVPAMVGQERKLYARYELCGLEALVVTIAAAYSIGAGILGVSILGGVVHYTRKHRIAAKQPELPQQA